VLLNASTKRLGEHRPKGIRGFFEERGPVEVCGRENDAILFSGGSYHSGHRQKITGKY
jgi:hypothetical protein